MRVSDLFLYWIWKQYRKLNIILCRLLSNTTLQKHRNSINYNTIENISDLTPSENRIKSHIQRDSGDKKQTYLRGHKPKIFNIHPLKPPRVPFLYIRHIKTHPLARGLISPRKSKLKTPLSRKSWGTFIHPRSVNQRKWRRISREEQIWGPELWVDGTSWSWILLFLVSNERVAFCFLTVKLGCGGAGVTFFSLGNERMILSVLEVLKEMGIKGIKTSHEMPHPTLLKWYR